VKAAHLTTVDISLKYLVFPQLEAIRDAGWQSVGISATGPWVTDLEQAGIRHIALESSTRGMDPLADVRAARELWRVLRTERFDVLHTHNPKPGLYGRVLGRIAGVPIVVNTVHGLYATPDDGWGKRSLVYLLEAAAARFSDAELVQSSEDAQLLARWHVTQPSRTTHLGNGIDLQRFDPSHFSDDDRASIRRELDIDPGKVVVGMVGRLVAEKGYPELFEAAAHLGEGYTVLCVGPDDRDKADALPQAVLGEAEGRGVRFLGMRTDVDALYAAMDIFVLPSHREGFPRSAMEAAAMALPVIATDIRGCREVVTDGVNGLLVPVLDPRRLGAAILQLGEDAELRARMGEAGRRRALEEFDERRVVATVMDTYRQVAARKGLPLFAPSFDDIGTRVATESDVAALARLHSDGISTGFLPTLGPRFMRRLYRALVDYEEAVVLVADDGSGPVGFVAGVLDTGRFYRHFVRHHGIQAILSALPRLLRPSVVRRAWESLRYEGGDADSRAELLATAIRPQGRGRGLGTKLGSEFLEQLKSRGATRVRVVVSAGNAQAIAAYRKMGFEDAGVIEVHAGEQSAVLIWAG
jgi:glycosyltransferase involved in cell wall biosynthesis/ribosomal protein S18 acetylase RimI-like enzyme